MDNLNGIKLRVFKLNETKVRIQLDLSTIDCREFIDKTNYGSDQNIMFNKIIIDKIKQDIGDCLNEQ